MMKSLRTIYFFVIAVIILPVTVLGITQWYESRFQRLPVLGPEKHVVGAFRFKTQSSEDFSQDQWKGKIVVANYFFTSCPSLCPKLMSALQKVQARESNKILINSFTVDPARDSVGKLNAYADKHDIKNGWFLLTGDKISLYKFARTDLLIDATDGDGGPGDFIHSDQLVLIDPLKRIRGYYTGTDENEINRLIRDIDKLQIEFHL
jgi:protein SCO1/2